MRRDAVFVLNLSDIIFLRMAPYKSLRSQHKDLTVYTRMRTNEKWDLFRAWTGAHAGIF